MSVMKAAALLMTAGFSLELEREEGVELVLLPASFGVPRFNAGETQRKVEVVKLNLYS